MATQLKVTISEEVAKRVRARIASGQYGSESEIVQEALETLEDHDRMHEERVERWLRTDVIEAYDALRADPSRGRSIEQVRATLAAEHEAAVTRKR